ncbi:hypothetical protein [uncultured Duncaniella sp.]|uniref:hypothetical protein n=1 Tax=uncultured Duncaniella sp. TaxID=2768039 RepID=UPI00266605B8|nr:hypothetical protein [uncultured Duncaniella sp.]
MYKIIYGMSLSRDDVLKRFKGMSDEISDHIMKCVIYGDSLNSLDHWTLEIGNWLNKANRVKGKAKIKEKDYYNVLFSACGDDSDDAEINLDYFQNRYCRRSNRYPRFEITYDLVSTLSVVYRDIISESIRIFKGSKVLSPRDWQQIVQQILNKYI